MKTAVLFAPGAGGAENFGKAGEAILRRFLPAAMKTCAGALGGDYLPGAALCEFQAASGYVETIRSAVASLARGAPELFVCVGGDGLASYVADALCGEGLHIPLLGIAEGTANAGPIVSMTAEELGGLDLDSLALERVGAVEALQDGLHLAYGFNDMVIASTFLGTVGGKVESLSVEAMAGRGIKVVEAPDPHMSTAGFWIAKNGHRLEKGMAHPAQLVVSPLRQGEFYGRAVAGVLCQAAYSPRLAGLALLESVLVRPSEVEEGVGDFARVDHLLFGPRDRLMVHGLSSGAGLVSDGNPFLLRNSDLEFRYRPELVAVARPARPASGGRRDVH